VPGDALNRLPTAAAPDVVGAAVLVGATPHEDVDAYALVAGETLPRASKARTPRL